MKFADQQLDYLPDSVTFELITFTKDSVLISTATHKFAGTWKLFKGQPNIHIEETDQFNYALVARGDNDIFFKTKNIGYYKYFQKVRNRNTARKTANKATTN